ncbi:cilia- and flagella-associated protein 69-like [Rhinoderma darwinii]|uniref:cilia- and flagella-associated protein 69-like n=1 Tax=Rhinoderma darwinii TaxID=43563 RepID=UPI003F679C26
MELLEEQQRYAAIKANVRQREKAQISWDDFVARTSNYEALKKAKQLKEDILEISRPEYMPQKGIYHATEVYDPNTTVSCCRVFHVQSTPSNLTGGPLADTYLVRKRLPIQGGALQKIRGRKSLK